MLFLLLFLLLFYSHLTYSSLFLSSSNCIWIIFDSVLFPFFSISFCFVLFFSFSFFSISSLLFCCTSLSVLFYSILQPTCFVDVPFLFDSVLSYYVFHLYFLFHFTFPFHSFCSGYSFCFIQVH